MNWKGSTLTRRKTEYGYDPNGGPYVEVEYEGSIEAMDSLVQTESAKGLVVSSG